MTRDERETIAHVDHGAGTATIWSTQARVWRRCQRAGWTLIFETKDRRGRVDGQEWGAAAKNLQITPRNTRRKAG